MKRVIVAIVLLLAVGVGVTLWIRARSSQETKLADIEAVRVQRGTVRKTVTADGVLRPLTTVLVKSDAGGRIDLLAVDVGDKVKKGDLIANIDPTDSQTAYDQAVADLTVARARLTQAREQSGVQGELTRTSIAQAQASYTAVGTDLDRLQKATQPLARAQARAALDKAIASLEAAQKDVQRLKEVGQPTARVQTSASLDKARSDLSLAEKELERTRGLRAEGLIPQSELDVVESRYEVAKADFGLAQERADTLAADQSAELRTAETRVEQAQADLASAQERWRTLDQEQAAELAAGRAKVAQMKASLDQAQANAVQERVRQAEVASAEAQVDRAQAQVARTKTTLSYTTITAPRDGVILQKFVEEGTIVTSGRSAIGAGMDIVELGDLTRMFVDVEVDESDLAELEEGQSVEIRVDAFGDDVLSGTVTRVDPQALATQNITTVKVEVEIRDRDPRLIPGLTATCDFLVAEIEDTLYVPSRAVRNLAKGHVVILLDGDQIVQVPVEVGLEGDEGTEIIGGLKEGDEIIIPQLGGPSGEMTNRAREMGRRMGGGGGFIRR